MKKGFIFDKKPPRSRMDEERINKAIDSEHIVCKKYSGNRMTKSVFMCKGCGKEFYRTWDVMSKVLKKGFTARCPFCANGNEIGFKKTTRLTVEKINDMLSNTGFRIVEYSTGNKIESLFIHEECGNTFKRKWNVVSRSLNKNSLTCPYCFTKGQKNSTTEEFSKKIQGTKYTLVGKYIDSHTKTIFRHNACGSEWEAAPCNILKSIREEIDSCPHCMKQNNDGSLAVFTKETAQAMFCSVKTEWYKIKNPKTKQPLYFDIYIEDINTVIEVHGDQHYRPGFNSTPEDFIELKFRDEYKKNWCLQNKINYVEIDTRKFNQSKVLMILEELRMLNGYDRGKVFKIAE